MSLLSINNLESWYGQIHVLKGVTLHVSKGEIVSIIGPNGAGKSTVLKNVFGLIKKRTGSITFNNVSIISKQPQDIVRLGMSYVPQGRSVFPSLTVEENLQLGAYIKKEGIENEIHRVYEKFPSLKERKHQKAGVLSGGEQQMVSLGRALMLQPQLLLLDEPSLGLSPQVKRVIFEKMVEINKEGISLLIVEQNARMSLELSDRAYVLETGQNRLEGPGKTLVHDKRVQHLYLGGQF